MNIYIYRQQINQALPYGSLILNRDPEDEIRDFGGSMDSHWWNAGSEERMLAWPGISLKDPDAFIPFETLSKDVYCPAELGLVICHHMIDELSFGYTTLTAASRDESLIPSESFFNDIYEMLVTGDHDFLNSIDFSIEHYKKRNMKSKAIWLLDMMERLEGVSEFTTFARTVLNEGRREFKVYAYLANKIVEHDRAHTHLKMPKKALEYSADKTSDIPGIWQVRKIKPFFSFFGDAVFVVCANEHERGVCFSISPDNFKEFDFGLGDIIKIRARVVGIEEKLLKLNYVKVLKNV